LLHCCWSRRSPARLRAQEFEVQRRALDEVIAEELLAREAKAKGITVGELLKREVDAHVETPSKEQLELAWSSAHGDVKQLSHEAGLKKIEEMMVSARRQRRREEYVRQLAAEAGVRVLLEPPRQKIDANGPHSVGPAEAPITIVEFTDYQCPFCAKARTTLRDVVSRYGNLVRIVYRDFPLSIHKNAEKAAEAASCAADQRMYDEMHERMFLNQSALDVPALKEHAAALKLDQARFDRCLDSGQYASAVAADLALGRKYGIDATPTIFINGRWVADASLPNLYRIIDDELTAAGVKPPKDSALFTK
jgi:protein-disulfide isomerase